MKTINNAMGIILRGQMKVIEVDIFRNSTQNFLVVLKGDF